MLKGGLLEPKRPDPAGLADVLSGALACGLLPNAMLGLSAAAPVVAGKDKPEPPGLLPPNMLGAVG